jgi:cell division septation protein DedD
MDWIRRNWPDLLIGLALLLVIGGIIATLLNGGNILPFGRNTTNQPATVSTQTTPESTATTPVAPTEVDGGSSATTDTGSTTGTTTTDTGVAAVDPNAVTNDTVTMPAEQGGDGTITPVSPTVVEGDTSSPDAATAAVDAVAPDATDVTTETATTDAATSAPTADVLPSGSATAPYRISVGAFGSAENAERRAQAFRDAGYPVFTGNQGDLVIVLLGPYNSQAEAEGVKAELQSSGLEADPIIYEFTPNDAANVSSSTDTSASDTSASTATPTEEPSTATTTTSAPTTSSSGRYLQVGAYNSLESAAPQRTTLEGLGFSVSAVEEDSFVKLLVGPYDDASIANAQSQLSAQGIDSFVR